MKRESVLAYREETEVIFKLIALKRLVQVIGSTVKRMGVSPSPAAHNINHSLVLEAFVVMYVAGNNDELKMGCGHLTLFD